MQVTNTSIFFLWGLKWNWLQLFQENLLLTQQLKTAEREALAWKEVATVGPVSSPKEDDDEQQKQRLDEVEPLLLLLCSSAKNI